MYGYIETEALETENMTEQEENSRPLIRSKTLSARNILRGRGFKINLNLRLVWINRLVFSLSHALPWHCDQKTYLCLSYWCFFCYPLKAPMLANSSPGVHLDLSLQPIAKNFLSSGQLSIPRLFEAKLLIFIVALWSLHVLVRQQASRL